MEKTEQHPITPPPELVRQWHSQTPFIDYVATAAARWGADQELEACVQVMNYRGQPESAKALFRARRPKPPSLKERALNLIPEPGDMGRQVTFTMPELEVIRKALEALPND
jgi:hypothetical protein